MVKCFGSLGTPFPHSPRNPAWCFSICYPHYLVFHLALQICSHSFTNTFLFYISFIIALLWVWLEFDFTSCIQQWDARRRMVLYLRQLNDGELYCICLCHHPCEMLSMSQVSQTSKTVAKFVVFISWLYQNHRGKFAEMLSYIRNQHEIFCDPFQCYMRPSALKEQALAVLEERILITAPLHTSQAARLPFLLAVL